MRTIVFHPHIFYEGVLKTYQETENAIQNPYEDIVRTTQMCFLNSDLFDYFDFVLIAESGNSIYISIDDDGKIYCPNIDRQLTKRDSLFKLWQTGAFD